MKTILLIIFALNIYSAFSVTTDYDLSETPERKIAAYIKDKLDGIDDRYVYEQMKASFIDMRLMNHNGKWCAPLLSLNKQLLPANISKQSLKDLVDDMAANAARNHYLHNALVKIEAANFTDFYEMIEKDSDKIPQLISFAMALDNLTSAMRSDRKTTRDIFNIWADSRSFLDPYKNAGLFFSIKYYSVRFGMQQSLNALRIRNIGPNFLRWVLPINILEASFADKLASFSDNKYVGCVLAANKPGDYFNQSTGSGPAYFSSDKNAICLRANFPLHWADLYSTWNMAFVSRLDPVCAIKLLIPSVSNYHCNPDEYIYNRGLALYAVCNFITHNRNRLYADWYYPQLTRLWGQVNAESARHYSEMVRNAKS